MGTLSGKRFLLTQEEKAHINDCHQKITSRVLITVVRQANVAMEETCSSKFRVNLIIRQV